MSNKNLLILIGVVIVLTTALTLALRGCNSKPIISPLLDSVLADVHKKDSLVRIAMTQKEDTIRHMKIIKDSLAMAIDAKEKSLEVSKAKVALLVAKGYASKGEPTAYLSNCDSLLNENVYLIDNISDYQRAQESLIAGNKQLLETQERVIALKDSAYTDLKGAFDFLASKYSKLDYNYYQANQKSKKRIGIGITGGYTYIDKFRPCVSLGIHYAIIKL